MKIRIGGKLCVRNRIDVVFAVHSLSVVSAALPLPYIIFGGELTEAYQVRTAVALMIEFTGTLIDDELEERFICRIAACPYVCYTGTLTHEVDPVDGTLLA